MKKHFTLRIELGDEAMLTRSDVADALVKLADRLQDDRAQEGIVRDINGNRVGEWTFKVQL